MRLEGKVAIVTGGSQGIGEAIVRRFAREGARCAIIYSRGAEAAERVAAGAGQGARAFRADCSDVAAIRTMVDEVGAAFGTIDILVNNAGTFKTVPIEETTEEIWDAQVDLNMKGTFFCTQAVLPWFARTRRGKVINMSSIAGVAAFPNCPAYCASKGGVALLTRAMAVELAGRGVNVNAIGPGNVATPINAHLRGEDQEAYMDAMRARTPSGRAFLDPDDIAGAAVFLASVDSDAVHGAILMVDDGWSA